MADPLPSAAQDTEQDFALPGQKASNVDDFAPNSADPIISQAQSQPQGQAPPSGPRLSGKAMFFGNLLKTLMSAVTNAQGNPNNAFDRGFASMSPTAQAKRQADLSMINSEADLKKAQATLVGLQAIQYEYNVKRLPQVEQEQHMAKISELTTNLLKEGVSVEAEADDDQAAGAKAMQLNSSDPRATSHAGRFMAMPDPKLNGKWIVGYVPSKNVLQDDLVVDGEVVAKAGTPLNAAIGQFIKDRNGDIKDFIKNMHSTLGNSKMPENQADADMRMQQLKSFIGIAGKTDPVWGKLAQDEMDAIQKNYAAMPKTAAALKALERPPKEEKAQEMVVGQINGRQVAGNINDLKAAGANSITKMGALESEKVVNARNLLDFMDNTDPDDPGILTLAKQLNKEGKLGPIMSRYQDWINKGGSVLGFDSGDPNFQKLLTGMGLQTTALMQVHVGSRGGAYILEHFQDLANLKKMSGTAFMAALDEEYKYIRKKAMLPNPKSRGGGSETEPTPDRPKSVPANAVWNPETRQWRLPQ